MPENKILKSIHLIDQYVGRNLRERRLFNGLSQSDLGEAVDVSIQQIQKYEKGINRISAGKLFTFSRLLNVPIAYFFEKSLLDNENISYVAEEKESYQSSSITKNSKNITEKEITSIIKVFSEISDEVVRRKIFELIKTLS